MRFVQQLRGYLTAEEQQYLFGQEANRPSAVATYLAVYAFLAGGFTERQPQFVYRAKQYLSRLSGRQDVYLEQAICALLLGQTEEASQSVDHSQEHDSIAFIRQHSQGSPDLLPGLCLYTERWFQDEVFPHFRDLAQHQASLKDYFADRQVQAYLEELPTEAEALEAEPSVPLHSVGQVGSSAQAAVRRASVGVRGDTEHLRSVAASRETYPELEDETDRDALIAVARSRIASRSTTDSLGSENRFSGGVSTAERIAQSADPEDSSVSRSPFQRLRSSGEHPKGGEGDDSTKMPPRRMGDRPARSRSSGLPRWLVPGVALLGILILAGLAILRIREWQSASQLATQTGKEMLVEINQPLANLPANSLSSANSATLDKESAKQLINAWLTAKAKALGSNHEVDALDQILMDPSLSKWRTDAEDLKRNNEYRSYKHEVKIESVELVSSNPSQATLDPTQATSPSPDPAQTANSTSNPTQTTSPNPDTTATAQSGSPQSTPGQSVPETEVVSPSSDPTTTVQSDSTQPTLTSSAPQQAKVIAEVTETTETYREGKLDGSSQTENLRVQYNLVRKEGRWRIQDWQIL
ncbi:MAG: DUF4101 domain-containing protein [Leptolyngbyaceae cyanobacterium RU_5_1]|nr:DUF4101 domain-containing protein [Leptolyngbyaceae cyanobacterium RU_5_1]